MAITFLTDEDKVLRYDAQTLTEEEKALARENIGAAQVLATEPLEDDIPKVFINGNIPTTKDDVLAEMQYMSKTESFFAYLKIKCQGTSSMSYDKKNFTVKLFSDEARETKLKKVFKDWGHESSKFVLKANYIDHSHARNIICANLWDEVVSSRPDYNTLPTEMRNSPRNGAVDGFPIKVYTNGTYQGVYTWNIGKDDWMWGMNEDNANHVLVCGETNTDGVYSENACNFRTLWSGTDGDDWSIEVGTNSTAVKNSLNALISCVMNTDDTTFKSTIGNYLDVQSAIDYYIHQYVICGIDNLAKNMLLATYDGVKWICGAYDMDSTFGLTPQGGTSTVRADYACPDEYKEQFSLLWVRIVNCFYEDIRTRYSELRKTVYTFGNIVAKFERFMDLIGSELFTEDATIYPIPSANTNNIKFLRNFVRDRLAYTDVMIPAIGVSVPATSLTLDKTSITFETFDPITINATVTPEDTTDAVVWVSSDTSIATVVGGIVTPLKVGDCTITARCGNYSAECAVVVQDPDIVYLKWIDGYYLDGTTGEPNAASGDSYTDFVNLQGATKFAAFVQQNYSSATGRFHFYNANKEYISYYGVSNNIGQADKLNLPEGTQYVRFYNKTTKKNITFITDVFRNGFVQLDASKFVASKIPTASGIVNTTNNNGYFDESIPVTAGKILNVFNAYRMDYTGESTVYGDRGIFFFDGDGNCLGQCTTAGGDTDTYAYAQGANGQMIILIPEGVASVKIGSHNTTKDYMWYRLTDCVTEPIEM